MDSEAFSTIELADGWSLGYLEVGRSDGPAVIHCHGSGSSRLEALMMAEPARALGVRLIGVDRPGIGRSDPSDYGLRSQQLPARRDRLRTAPDDAL